ncbi:MAG TPA: DUF2627 domain-containing protein [Pseudogracilibacillus sp.]|nr:DUF2627 domain-containing protein [Pseudogracilibacillus sp.]
MGRLLALIVIVTPGIIGAIGIKLMRDALFYEVYSFLFNAGIQFIVGLIMFIFGLVFIGGFIFHRDRKRQLINNYKENNKEE